MRGVLTFGNHSAPGAACSQTRCHHELHACTCSIYHIITQHVTVVMQLANPRHPRPVHISRYCPLSQSNITRYGPDFDPEYNNKNGKSACNKCVSDRAPGQYRTRYMPSRLRRSGYCPSAWPVTQVTYIYAPHCTVVMFFMSAFR